MCFGGAEEGNVGPGSHHQAEVSDWPRARGPGRVAPGVWLNRRVFFSVARGLQIGSVVDASAAKWQEHMTLNT